MVVMLLSKILYSKVVNDQIEIDGALDVPPDFWCMRYFIVSMGGEAFF